MTTIPLLVPSRLVWKNSANCWPLAASVTFGRNSPPKRAFWAERWSLRSSSGCGVLEDVAVDTDGGPHAVEVARFVFVGDEAPVEPHPGTPSISEDRQSLGQAIEELTSAQVPPEPRFDLVPGGWVFARQEETGDRVERRNRHLHNIPVVCDL